MKFLVEEESYSKATLEELFDDPKFYTLKGDVGVINSVGYYHSFVKNELVYMLPKVFMKDREDTVFDISKDELLNIDNIESFKHKDEYLWIRQLSIYFYNSLIEFKKRNSDSKNIQYSKSFALNTNLGDKEYSYLDLVLSFVNFHKQNKNLILYKHIEHKSSQVRRTKWEKTIRKSLPIITNNNKPVYSIYRNKRKSVNTEEELITYFYSILNHLNSEHNLFIKIDKSYKIFKGESFKQLVSSGKTKLRKIKHRYFNDSFVKMYKLCDIYFSIHDKGSVKKKKEDFISISNYNIIFEDMIDKLFSNDIEDMEINGNTIAKLKKNKDGKMIDHIYDDKSLIDTENIFFIGDSKYYKSNSHAGSVSKYKQFTYAKNVIQFNIDLLNNRKSYKKINYLDKITEGYNISPNFFIYGYIDNVKDFDDANVIQHGDIVNSFHFEDRLFDRDTLFVHPYRINFLFVLKAYTIFNQTKIDSFRLNTKKVFRDKFINFFKDKDISKFELFSKDLSETESETLVNSNFRTLLGKCYYTVDNELILAKYIGDNSMDAIISSNDFSSMILE